MNLMTDRGTVHAPGKYDKLFRNYAPLCMGTGTATAHLRALCETEEPVTCKRCLRSLPGATTTAKPRKKTINAPYGVVKLTKMDKSGLPEYEVSEGAVYRGMVRDELLPDGTSLTRGRFFAWSAKTGDVGFFPTKEEAANAVAMTFIPSLGGIRKGDTVTVLATGVTGKVVGINVGTVAVEIGPRTIGDYLPAEVQKS